MKNIDDYWFSSQKDYLQYKDYKVYLSKNTMLDEFVIASTSSIPYICIETDSQKKTLKMMKNALDFYDRERNNK